MRWRNVACFVLAGSDINMLRPICSNKLTCFILCRQAERRGVSLPQINHSFHGMLGRWTHRSRGAKSSRWQSHAIGGESTLLHARYLVALVSVTTRTMCPTKHMIERLYIRQGVSMSGWRSPLKNQISQGPDVEDAWKLRRPALRAN